MHGMGRNPRHSNCCRILCTISIASWLRTSRYIIALYSNLELHASAHLKGLAGLTAFPPELMSVCTASLRHMCAFTRRATAGTATSTCTSTSIILISHAARAKQRNRDEQGAASVVVSSTCGGCASTAAGLKRASGTGARGVRRARLPRKRLL